MKKSQGFSVIPVLAIVMALVVLTMIGWATVVQFTKSKPAANQNAVACTLDAKVCPDGVTYVGRQAPNCEFAACPATNTNSGANANTAADAMKDWKTYTNVNVGYSIQYPPKWSVEEAEIVKIVSDEIWSVQSQAPGSPRYLIFIQAIKNPNDEVDKLQDRKTVMVNGVAADQGLIIGIPYERVTVFQRGATAVRISWSGRTDETGAEIEYQILSTFQFTDQTAATKDWKTYTNATNRFSFRYPKEWYIQDKQNNSWILESWNRATVVARGGLETGMIKADFSFRTADSTDLKCSVEEGETLVSCSDVAINGVTYKKQVTDSVVEGGGRSVSLRTVRNGKLFGVNGFQRADDGLIKLDQIFSTFTFTD